MLIYGSFPNPCPEMKKITQKTIGLGFSARILPKLSKRGGKFLDAESQVMAGGLKNDKEEHRQRRHSGAHFR